MLSQKPMAATTRTTVNRPIRALRMAPSTGTAIQTAYRSWRSPRPRSAISARPEFVYSAAGTTAQQPWIQRFETVTMTHPHRPLLQIGEEPREHQRVRRVVHLHPLVAADEHLPTIGQHIAVKMA